MSYAGSKPIEADDIIADTWEKLGRKQLPMGSRILVRTEIPRKITPGGIILTDKQAHFYAGLPNIDLGPDKRTAFTWGNAVALGPDVSLVELGQRVIFPRGHFAWHKKFEDGSMVGWIHEENVWLVLDD